jgi:hypothetical protein
MMWILNSGEAAQTSNGIREVGRAPNSFPEMTNDIEQFEIWHFWRVIGRESHQ